jgi:hypothetical protein
VRIRVCQGVIGADNSMTIDRSASTVDLFGSERGFFPAMKQLGFRHSEIIRICIHNRELLLNPWLTTARQVNFG